MGASNYVHLDDCFVLTATAMAVRITYVTGAGETGEGWFPRSQIDGGDGLKRGDGPRSIAISEWIAKKNNVPN